MAYADQRVLRVAQSPIFGVSSSSGGSEFWWETESVLPRFSPSNRKDTMKHTAMCVCVRWCVCRSCRGLWKHNRSPSHSTHHNTCRNGSFAYRRAVWRSCLPFINGRCFTVFLFVCFLAMLAQFPPWDDLFSSSCKWNLWYGPIVTKSYRFYRARSLGLIDWWPFVFGEIDLRYTNPYGDGEYYYLKHIKCKF